MSGALNSVLGGGGGGLLSAIGGIVGGAFGGPLGAMIGQAVGNLLQDQIGKSVNEGVNELQQQHGMPKFIGDQIKDTAGQTLAGLRNNSVPADVEAFAKDKFGAKLEQFGDSFKSDLVSNVLRLRGLDSEEGSGGGWLQAIAKAMGKTLGQKASELVEMSAEMSALNDERGNKTDLGGLTGDAKKSAQTEQASKDADNAQQFNETMTKFQATSQEYSMLNNTFSTAIKALGEALGSMARKQ